tara:strand:- start:778 stop:1440 length:663 start_codon:yes stop_codon:yes gene_type:complete
MIRLKKNYNNNLLILFSNITRKIFKGDRLKRLSIGVSDFLETIYLNKKKKLSILDYGCGSMDLSKKIQNKKFISKITAVDIYKARYKNKKIKYLNDKFFFKKNTKKFDAIVIVDVLHHMGIDDAHKILKKLSKYSKFIIVKDHYEHGFLSRHLLRFVDFYANYAYGVKIPKKYFDKYTWKSALKKANLEQIKHHSNFQQHDGLYNFILNKKHHFISLLKK